MRLSRLLALYGSCAALLAAHIASASIDATTATLSNGLSVIIAPVHTAPVATVGILYKAGSRNETPWTTGVAHQVEHMLFKGTTDLLKPGDVDRRFYDNNASTDQDSTYYYESFEKSELDSALQIEADRMEHAAFDPAQLASENAVVLSELAASADIPADALDQQVEATAMQAHQYHWPAIGWKDVVSSFAVRRDLVYGFYVEHYAPQNAVLVVAGDVEPAAALALVHKYFDGVPVRPVAALQPVIEPAQHGTRRVNVSGPGSASLLELAYHVPGAYAPDAYALDVLDAIVNGGQSARLYRALVTGGYANSLSTATNAAVDPYVYSITATIEQDTTADKAREVIDAELRRLAAHPVTPAELARAKKQVIVAHVLSHDGIESLAQSLAAWQAWTGDWRNDERFTARVEAVTAAQVQDVVRRYIASDNVTVGTYIPLAKDAASGGAAHRRNARATHRRVRVSSRMTGFTLASAAVHISATEPVAAASPSPAPAVSAPAGPQRRVLSNGLVLIVQENHANPSAVILASTSAGSAFDSSATSGLAALTQEMLMRGTVTRSYDQFQEALDSLGASMDTSLDIDAAAYSLQMLASDEPKALELVADMLQHPRFAFSDYRDAQSQLVAERQAAQEDPSSVARETLYRNLYPAGSAWALPRHGTIGGLRGLRLSDIRSFYRVHYQPNHTVIVVAGDVDAVQIGRQVQMLFGGWKRSERPTRPLIWAASSWSGPTRTIAIVIPGTSQVAVMAGALGAAPAADDYHAAQLMNFVLGGGSFISKLLHQVRDVDGYVYSIGSSFRETGIGAGPWTMHLATDRHNVHKALDEAVAQMRGLQSNGVSEQELAQYRRLAVDAVLTGELSNQGLAEELLRDESLDRGLDYPSRLTQLYAAVTPAQVQAAAQKYLHPDNLVISAAGPKF